jgi:hypothetical protein
MTIMPKILPQQPPWLNIRRVVCKTCGYHQPITGLALGKGKPVVTLTENHHRDCPRFDSHISEKTTFIFRPPMKRGKR